MNERPSSTRRLWLLFAFVVLASFAVLGGFGFRIAALAPPVPARVVTPDGRELFDGDRIREGQNVWQSLGGQEIGTVWGHGAYVAPDWSADWLHRECVFLLDRWARQRGASDYAALPVEDQAAPGCSAS
jgi:nitric oxide reductase subunit B